MKHPILLVSTIALVCFLTSCDDPITQSYKQREARVGLDKLVAQLPTLTGFETIKSEYFEGSDNWRGKTCYYARVYLIIGSSLPMPKALDNYVGSVRSLGWTLEREQYETTRHLIRGSHDRLVIETGKLGNIVDAEEFAKWHEIYQSLIFVRLDYMLPQRDGC